MDEHDCKNNLKYNYVVFGNDGDYMRIAYGDLSACDWAKYIENLDCNSKIANKLYKYHTSPRLNQSILLPFRKVWNNLSFHDEFTDGKPICFVFFGCDTRRIDNGLIPFLRKNYTGCKIVSFCQDLVRTYGKKFDLYRKYFDRIYSFDQNDVKKYGLNYYPLVYSRCNNMDCSDTLKSDVYFVGKAKDRLKSIMDAYYKLKDSGLTCEFYLIEVPKEEIQLNLPGVHYCEGVSYIDNLKHINNTRCLLEIMQGGGHGYTLRYAEALMYDKKLLTNNPEIKDAPFYDSRCISVFTNAESIDSSFIKTDVTVINDRIKQQLSPLTFFEHIDFGFESS